MKKLLSILGVIGLTATSTTTLISCKKTNNNENSGGNKPEPTPEPEKPQEPPNGSHGKGYPGDELNHGPTNKGYILISKSTNSSNAIYAIDLIHFTTNASIKPTYTFLKSIYKGEELNKPSLPIINSKTGKIIDGKE